MAAGEVTGSGAAPATPKVRKSGPPEGMVKCPGSLLDIEKTRPKVKLAENSAELRSGDPWDWRGKKVICPSCSKRSGIYVVGKRKTDKEPTAYKIDPHYVKAEALQGAGATS